MGKEIKSSESSGVSLNRRGQLGCTIWVERGGNRNVNEGSGGGGGNYTKPFAWDRRGIFETEHLLDQSTQGGKGVVQAEQGNSGGKNQVH